MAQGTMAQVEHHLIVALGERRYLLLHAASVEKDGRALNVRVDGQLVFNDTPMILQAAAEGFGLAFVLEDRAEELIKAGRLVRVLPEFRLANLVTGALFLAAMFIHPLASIVPTEVAAAALVVVGTMMVSQLRHIDVSEFSVALPVVLTVATMPSTTVTSTASRTTRGWPARCAPPVAAPSSIKLSGWMPIAAWM